MLHVNTANKSAVNAQEREEQELSRKRKSASEKRKELQTLQDYKVNSTQKKENKKEAAKRK